MERFIPKRLNAEKVEYAIRAAEKGSCINQIAKNLNTAHSDLYYHFNKKPYLRKLYEKIHMSARLAEEAKKVRWIKEKIKTARKHIMLKDLAKNLSMSYSRLFSYMRREKGLSDYYHSIHGPHKISQKTLDTLCNASDNAPPGTPMYQLDCHLNLSYYAKIFPEIGERYEKRHGKTKKS